MSNVITSSAANTEPERLLNLWKLAQRLAAKGVTIEDIKKAEPFIKGVLGQHSDSPDNCELSIGQLQSIS